MVRPHREKLRDKVEVDETYLGGPEAGLRGGRELQEKALVVGAVEVRGTASGRVRLQVVPDASGSSLTGFVRAQVEPGTIVVTDGWRGYASLSGLGYRHRPRIQGAPQRAETILPRVHRVLGTHHGVGNQHLQASSTSSRSASTAAARPWRPFRRCLALAPNRRRPPTRSCMEWTQPDKQNIY
jgi:transposase-like protein